MNQQGGPGLNELFTPLRVWRTARISNPFVSGQEYVRCYSVLSNKDSVHFGGAPDSKGSEEFV